MYHQACAALEPGVRPFQSDLPSRFQALRAELAAMQDEIERSPRAIAAIRDVRAVIQARSKRRAFFDGDLFADPAWDMLLELYACDLAHRRISVSAICLASNVPPTTGLRWLTTLERAQLAKRIADPMDGRRFWVSLTEAGREKMDRYFEAIG